MVEMGGTCEAWLVTGRADSEATAALIGALARRGVTLRVSRPSESAAWRATRLPVGLIDVGCASEIEPSALDTAVTGMGTLWIALTGHGVRWTSDLKTFVWLSCWSSISLDEPVDAIVELVRRAHAHRRFAPEERAESPERFGPFVGGSADMRAMYGRLERIAGAAAPVLVHGETGTGKELVANVLHERSPRRARPFIAVNCGALPTHLIASELFGHERGAFTGAAAQRVGRLEQANGGTLFLDEIGDLPMDAQTYLLRALQEGVVERLGGTRPIPVDVRIVAASHVNLDAAVADGRFRLDLLHRLKVLEIRVPPLRERGDDIRRLAEHFLEQFRPDSPRRIRGFAPEAMQAMLLHSWPGNVRELSNRVRQAVVMGESGWLSSADLGLVTLDHDSGGSLDEVRERAEVQAIRTALIRSGRNYSRAAQALGVSRMTLYRLVQKHQDTLRDVTGPSMVRAVDPPAKARA